MPFRAHLEKITKIYITNDTFALKTIDDKLINTKYETITKIFLYKNLYKKFYFINFFHY